MSEHSPTWRELLDPEWQERSLTYDYVRCSYCGGAGWTGNTTRNGQPLIGAYRKRCRHCGSTGKIKRYKKGHEPKVDVFKILGDLAKGKDR